MLDVLCWMYHAKCTMLDTSRRAIGRAVAALERTQRKRTARVVVVEADALRVGTPLGGRDRGGIGEGSGLQWFPETRAARHNCSSFSMLLAAYHYA